MGVGWSDFIDGGDFVFVADEESLVDADFGGRWEWRIGRWRIWWRLLFVDGCGPSLFLFGQFEAFAVELETLFLEFVLLLPVLFGESVFGDGAKVVESALEGAFGLGFVAIEEIEGVEIGVDPEVGVGTAGVKSGFIVGEGALTPKEEPAGEDGISDEGRVLIGGGLMVLEGVFEEREEVFGVLVGEKERVGSA